MLRTPTLLLFALISTLVSLSGCGSISHPSKQFARFRINPMRTVALNYPANTFTIKPEIVVQKEVHEFTCRFSGVIYLPHNYSTKEYINEIVTKSLYAADLLAPKLHKKVQYLQIKVHSITLNSLYGRWSIKADIYVNKKLITTITSNANFQSNFNASATCSYAANTFDDLIVTFVTAIFANTQIKDALHRL